jgi:hypothetical protein
MTSSSNSARLQKRPASHEGSAEMHASMPVTLRASKVNRQTFRCFPSFQEGQPIAKLITAMLTPSDKKPSRVRPMINASEDATMPKTRRRIRRTAECASKAPAPTKKTIASAEGTAAPKWPCPIYSRSAWYFHS